ncbi:hypothetical protein PENARI_c073G06512 [Penicillium arizonense]|uniref:Uncharacterized protein n=1 Tax=Penicillium arizonense TaxID=1835702 RepID=A0A1F5L1W7_PENAI|nr:hypothetical protein PENARI_c073G06512 [Penicillium arizonense]OGE47037.1 hypothetical protein PENARI_c073G06512 [Penicillium arizonense]
MGTQDQFLFGQISYPQYISIYPSVVDNRYLETSSHDFVYEQPPPAPFLAAPPAVSRFPPPLPPKYRAIRPQPKKDGPETNDFDDTLQLKPRKRRKSRRLPQERSDESKVTQSELDVNIASSARAGSERFGLPNFCYFNKPQADPKAVQCSSAPFSQYTDSDICSSCHEPTFASCPPSSSKDFASPKWNGLLPLLNDACEALVTDRPVYPHDVRRSLISPDIHVPLPSGFLELSQNQDSKEADFVGLAAHLEKTQVLQSLAIVQDYMAKHPSIFEVQAPGMIQRWTADIEALSTPGSLSE